MQNTIEGPWVPFGKPIKFRSGFDEGWLLAWRLRYGHQPKAFEPSQIEGIDYLDSLGDILYSEDIEFVDNPGREQ